MLAAPLLLWDAPCQNYYLSRIQGALVMLFQSIFHRLTQWGAHCEEPTEFPLSHQCSDEGDSELTFLQAPPTSGTILPGSGRGGKKSKPHQLLQMPFKQFLFKYLVFSETSQRWMVMFGFIPSFSKTHMDVCLAPFFRMYGHYCTFFSALGLQLKSETIEKISFNIQIHYLIHTNRTNLIRKCQHFQLH